MKKILSLIFVLITLLSISSLSAQMQQDANLIARYPHMGKQYTIAIQPLYIHNSSLRLDFEKRLNNSPAWLQIGLTSNILPKTTDDKYNNYWLILADEEFNELYGGTLDINYKRFFNRKETWYYAGGCSFSHYNIEYVDRYIRSFTEDGMVYHEFDYGPLKQVINKVGMNTFIGYQPPTTSFLFDVFMGLGYRYSFRKNDDLKHFNYSPFSFGYKGIVLIAGVRFGVKFK
jgi:opacity protein-like surface antigen